MWVLMLHSGFPGGGKKNPNSFNEGKLKNMMLPFCFKDQAIWLKKVWGKEEFVKIVSHFGVGVKASG